jgi:hypothetical protein
MIRSLCVLPALTRLDPCGRVVSVRAGTALCYYYRSPFFQLSLIGRPLGQGNAGTVYRLAVNEVKLF